MKEKIKKILKIFISKKFILKYKFAIDKVHIKNGCVTIKDKIKCLLFDVKKVCIIDVKKFSKSKEYIKEKIIYTDNFSYLIDFNCFAYDKAGYNHNMTPDYSVILENSLNDLSNFYKKNNEQLLFIKELEKYLNYYITLIEKSDFKNKDNNIKYLQNIKDSKCSGFLEALQRILFFNQIFWQMGYKLCGLGRLDYILEKYYNNDIKNKILNEKITEKAILEFYQLLNYHYYEKSGSLSGDTGQIIVLGGVDVQGNNIDNDLTHLFIKALKKFNSPDPKILLRVNKNTNDELLKEAVDCMSTGIGSPLLSNDDIIIPRLIKFGYDNQDAWNYVTAACWEPSPCGNSIDWNNAEILNLLEPLNTLFEKENINVKKLEKHYFNNLDVYIKEKLTALSTQHFNSQPYMSLFIKNCRETGTLISDGKAKYKNLGVTTLGIANVVNSILNIKMIVEDKKIMSFEELNEIRKNNFNNEDILKLIKYNNKFGYGSNNALAIELTNKISKFISKEFKKYKTYYGGDFKFGLSAPSYVEFGKNIPASFDGRKNNEPLNVHISSSQNSFLDVMDFASSIEYCHNGINGNVVDFIINPTYMKKNINKFADYLKSYICKGVYQLQINVIDSKTLLAAKGNPDLYKNLIVRVWGFSAYFNDLPEEYKDLLIKRTLEAEKVSV